jgi:hypothetical protein
MLLSSFKSIEFRGKCLLFLAALLVSSPFLSLRFANAGTQEGFAPRSLEIWGRAVQYQFILKNDSHLKYDGEAYTKKIHGQKISYVVLNKTYFKNEADEIFQRLEGSEDLLPTSPSHDQLTGLETNLLAYKSSQENVPGMKEDLQLALRDLQKTLEQLAWLTLYQSSIKRTSSRKDAQRMFEEGFSLARLDTIEHHEAAHLLDLQDQPNNQNSEFEKFSELNAFYTELAYGSNPQDVIAQAIAGLIDEMNQGKIVDFSTLKVATVIQFLKHYPGLSKNFDKGPMSRSCLAILTDIQNHDWSLAGKELYQKNQANLKVALANPR